MDSVKAQQVPIKEIQSGKSSGRWWARIRSLRILQGLQAKLIIPYLILTLIIAFIGLFVITNLVVRTQRERFFNSMLGASRVANDGIVGYEKSQLDKLRFLVFTDGMAKAFYERDDHAISVFMHPVLANSRINLVAALDQQGREIITFRKASDTDEYKPEPNVDFSRITIIQKVLNGELDQQGDKFVQVVRLDQGNFLVTAAPVRDSAGQLVGAMLVATDLKGIVEDLQKQSLSEYIVLLDNQSNLIETTLKTPEEGYDALLQIAKNIPGDERTTRLDEFTLNRRSTEVAYSPFTVRNQPVGWLGILQPNDYWTDPATTARNLFLLVFSLGTLAVFLTGYFLSQNIARPVIRLRDMAQGVAGGNLDQRTGLHRSDEIGELAESFDTMTLQLRERTDRANRLYEESLRRNRELADINARLEAAQLQLIQSEKLASIGQLTAGIVHDVKNPFAVIMGMAEMLGENDQLDESMQHGLKVIRESSIKGDKIVSDLLKFARQSKPEMRTMDLRETVQTSMRLTAYLTRRYHTAADLPDRPMIVTYDSQQVEQVLINMIHNAVQAMPNGGELGISLKQVDSTAQISIRDTGCGIPAENLQRIFDPFFTTKREGEGTGLGLSVSYGIITNHRGRIDVESEAGKGTIFTIILPLTQPSSSNGETGEIIT